MHPIILARMTPLSDPLWGSRATAAGRLAHDVAWRIVRGEIAAGEMLTEVRQRVTREVLGRRGRKEDSVWAHRMLLLRAGDRLTDAGLHRLEQVFDDEDYEQVAAAWAVKERLRALLAARDIPAVQNARIDFEMAVAAADMAETDKLAATVGNWWTEIKVFVRTQVTNARTESANTGIKQIKRTGRGYRNPAHYQGRILLRSARRTRRRRTLIQQATTLNCG